MLRLTIAHRWRIIGKLELNDSITFRENLTALEKKRVVKNRLNATGDVVNRRRPGSQRVFNERRQRQLLRAASQERWMTAVEHVTDFGT